MTQLRRNDVVLVPNSRDGMWEYDGYNFYGRVNRVLDAKTVEVLCCGKYVQAIPIAAIPEEHVNSYDGGWAWGAGREGHLRDRYPVYNYMPTLRQLKQRTSGYNPGVWSKPKTSKRVRVYGTPEAFIEYNYYKPPYDFVNTDYRRRHYHDWSHIEDCLEKLDVVWPELGRRSRSLLRDALTWHDVIYEWDRKDNEQRSADYYHAFYYDRRLKSKRFVDEVCRLIVLTKGHTVNPTDRRGAIMVSIDLSILGAPPEKYSEYAKNIRKEYKEVPEELYRTGRVRVLQKFLDTEFIYPDERARDLYETQARINIAREIEELNGKTPNTR